MNSNNNHPESDCGNYPSIWFDKASIPVSELPNEAEQVAKELVEKFYEVLLVDGSLNEKRICYGYAKQCALIECEDMIDELSDLINDSFISMDDIMRKKVEVKIESWQQVRTAINQLYTK